MNINTVSYCLLRHLLSSSILLAILSTDVLHRHSSEGIMERYVGS